MDWLFDKVNELFKSYIDAGREGERLADEAHKQREEEKRNEKAASSG